VIVTLVPPAAGPVFGLTLVTTGLARASRLDVATSARTAQQTIRA
jgi:hypothetical protein